MTHPTAGQVDGFCSVAYPHSVAWRDPGPAAPGDDLAAEAAAAAASHLSPTQHERIDVALAQLTTGRPRRRKGPSTMQAHQIPADFWADPRATGLPPQQRLLLLGVRALAGDGSTADDPLTVAEVVFPAELATDEGRALTWVVEGLDALVAAGLLVRVKDRGRETLQVPAPAVSDTGEAGQGALDLGVPASGRALRVVPEDQFDAFWAVYPVRKGKQAARRAWKKVVAAGVDQRMVVAAAARHRDDPNRDQKFTKHPATWLNAGCWEDDPEPERPLDRRDTGAAFAGTITLAQRMAAYEAAQEQAAIGGGR